MTIPQINAIYSGAGDLRRANRERYETADSKAKRASAIQQAVDAYAAEGLPPPVITE